MSLLLIGCAAQNPMPSLKTMDANPVLSFVQAGSAAENLSEIKSSAVSPFQTADVEEEAKPVKEAGEALDQTMAPQVQPAPEEVSIALTVQYDTGKADVKPKDHDAIKGIADFMKKYPAAKGIIGGHTDNIGKALINVKLSYRRAANIKAYLVRVFGIERSRLKVIGYDYQKPIAGNDTSQGRQKNRRTEIHIDAQAFPNSLYSFFEDSELPKGGPAIVNQETIDEKIRLFKEKHGAASYASIIVKTPTLELYKMWNGIFSHCAIRIETAPRSFYQLELQALPDLEKAGMKGYHRIGAAISLLGINKDQFDIVEFTDKKERIKLDDKEPPYATIPICVDKKSARKTTRQYQACLSRYARSYNPENALKAGQRTKVFDYNPPVHNCCNFAEEVLEACGLAHCFDLGKSSGLDSKTGPLEE